jgi:hypothetical protein
VQGGKKGRGAVLKPNLPIPSGERVWGLGQRMSTIGRVYMASLCP